MAKMSKIDRAIAEFDYQIAILTKARESLIAQRDADAAKKAAPSHEQ